MGWLVGWFLKKLFGRDAARREGAQEAASKGLEDTIEAADEAVSIRERVRNMSRSELIDWVHRHRSGEK